jgi:cyclopropane-fatty-acyl-phospholipid synthase
MGPYYARTLHVWRENFHRVLDAVRAQGFDETFIRKWDYYLAYCEAAFAARHISVVQAVYTRADNETLDLPTGLNRGCS